MTANQIMIPLGAGLLVAFVLWIWIRNKLIAKRTPSQTHQANTPDNGVDKGAIARSAMSGYSGSDNG